MEKEGGKEAEKNDGPKKPDMTHNLGLALPFIETLVWSNPRLQRSLDGLPLKENLNFLLFVIYQAPAGVCKAGNNTQTLLPRHSINWST